MELVFVVGNFGISTGYATSSCGTSGTEQPIVTPCRRDKTPETVSTGRDDATLIGVP